MTKLTTSNSDFIFSQQNKEIAEQVLNKYPENRRQSAILSLLDLAQRQNLGYLSREAIEYVADYIGIPHIKAYEVASFYTMFNLKPVGKHFIQVCGTTPCWLNGAGEVMEVCKKELGIKKGETTADDMFTLTEVECLGACVNAPIVQINDDYYEDVSPAIMKKIIDDLKAGKLIKVGSQIDRINSAPVGHEAKR